MKKRKAKTVKPHMPLKPFYPVMRPGEFARAREHFDLSFIQFSKLIGVGWRQAQRYRDGESVIPDSVAKLIRTMIRHELAPGDIG